MRDAKRLAGNVTSRHALVDAGAGVGVRREKGVSMKAVVRKVRIRGMEDQDRYIIHRRGV